jgi:hypothetical protein
MSPMKVLPLLLIAITPSAMVSGVARAQERALLTQVQNNRSYNIRSYNLRSYNLRSYNLRSYNSRQSYQRHR